MNKDRLKFRVWDKKEETYDSTKIYPWFWEETTDFCTDEVIVEQCTGLKDKNKKLIYEGDFIKSKFNGIGRITYYHAALVVAWKDKTVFYGHETTSTPIPLDTENIEVIGNIHENPELLK